LEALIEKVVIPQANNSNVSNAPPTPPKPLPGTKELKEAFITADRSAIIFYLDLGPSQVGNRQTLARSLAAGIRAAALTAAEESGGDQAEAVRAAGDALSCAGDVTFLGQATRPYKNGRDSKDPKNGSYHTMPVKFEFEDRQQRIYFEQTMRKCKLRASISLPPFMQKERTAFDKALRDRYPDHLIMVRPDPDRVALIAFKKIDKAPKWEECSEIWIIPPSAVFAGRDDPPIGDFRPVPEVTMEDVDGGEDC
jgi:hypothetical protein